MECRHVKGFKHIFLYARNKDQHRGFYYVPLSILSTDFLLFWDAGNERHTKWNERHKGSTKTSKSPLKFFAFCPIILPAYFPFQVISVIRPPGLPGKKADRRIWRMMTIVRRLAFVRFLHKYLFSHTLLIM